jgi:antitoxin MazE
MVTKVVKWGNSLGLRIPRSFAKEAGVGEGSEVDISLEGDSLIVRPVRPAVYRLRELVSLVREDNIHEEIETDGPTGREAW